MTSDLAPRSQQAEWLADLADSAADLGMGIRAVTETSVTLYQGNDTTITVESHFLSGRMLRSLLRPRPDPSVAELGFDAVRDKDLRVAVRVTPHVARIP